MEEVQSDIIHFNGRCEITIHDSLTLYAYTNLGVVDAGGNASGTAMRELDQYGLLLNR